MKNIFRTIIQLEEFFLNFIEEVSNDNFVYVEEGGLIIYLVPIIKKQ